MINAFQRRQLQAELARLREHLSQGLSIEGTEPFMEAVVLAPLVEAFERIAQQASTAGDIRLSEHCQDMAAWLRGQADRGQLRGSMLERLQQWPDRIAAYLESPSNSALHLAQDIVSTDTSPSVRVRAEDVALTPSADIAPELLDSLVQELPQQISAFSACVQKLLDGTAGPGELDTAQRIIHTVKGATTTAGVVGIASISHHLEDILSALARSQQLPVPALGIVLMDASDCLEAMTESLLDLGPPPANAIDVLRQVLDWSDQIDRDGIDTASSTTWKLERGSEPAKPEPQARARGAPSESLAAETSGRFGTRTETTVRVPAAMLDQLLRLIGEGLILDSQLREHLRLSIEQSRQLRQQHRSMQQLTDELERLIDRQRADLPPADSDGGGNSGRQAQDRYKPLYDAVHQLIETDADSQVLGEALHHTQSAIDEMMVERERIQHESQELVLNTRMVPVRSIVPRLRRTVRQTCRLLDREAQLRVDGENTLIDSQVLNGIIDPLMHLLRNAIDHGIEPPAERHQRGKPPAGLIQLDFAREGNSIMVRCHDDGRGLDLEAIRRIAEQRGLLTSGKPLNDDELFSLVLQPGFSTRERASSTSGRGIGLDAVNDQIRLIKGSLGLSSTSGYGCTFELRLPVTLIATHALLARAGRRRYALAERGIERILHPDNGRLVSSGRVSHYVIDDRRYPVHTLESLLRIDPGPNQIPPERRPVLLVRNESGHRRAVLVETLVDSRELVFKRLGRFTPPLPGLLGATILGDGAVVPILDLNELLRLRARL
ncbi:MAG: chemotaxis protein CheW, partial [Candidatus Competibacterales bacterium]|nr:chemotaxis protein CheW [Candidatus Competibacterales bacterium]